MWSNCLQVFPFHSAWVKWLNCHNRNNPSFAEAGDTWRISQQGIQHKLNVAWLWTHFRANTSNVYNLISRYYELVLTVKLFIGSKPYGCGTNYCQELSINLWNWIFSTYIKQILISKCWSLSWGQLTQSIPEQGWLCKCHWQSCFQPSRSS